MSIEGKIAVVTGGSGGLGRVHCLSLAGAGCNVAVIAHSHPEKAEAVVEELRASGRKAIAVKMDIANLVERQVGSNKIKEALGPIDIQGNNVATGCGGVVLW